MPFVVRPKSILGTPKQIAVDLGWRLRYYPHPRRPDRMFNYRRDFIMFPVNLPHVTNAPVEYNEVVSFAHMNKFGQRKALERYGIPVPRAAIDHGTSAETFTDPGLRFVVRPLRHSGGLGYRVVDKPTDFAAGSEYISELFPKKREYRVIFVFGKPLIWLRKKPHEGIDAAAPWGAANSSFQTINDTGASRLAGTDCVSRLEACPVVRSAHICAADILYNKSRSPSYAVLELNFCPGVDIDNNRVKIVEAIHNRG